METCNVCGEESLKEECENGRNIRVCTECGAIVDEKIEYCSEHQYEGTTITDGVARRPHGAKLWMKDKDTVPKGLINGKMLIACIGSQLKLSSEMIQVAVATYENVYIHELHGRNNDTKKAMCVACLYTAARIHKYPINIRHMEIFLNIKHSSWKFGTALKCLKDKYDVHLPPVNITDQTYCILMHSDLPMEVVRTTQQLMLVLERVFLTQGRSCSSTALPCAFLAWKATDYQNRKVTFKEFCSKFKMKISVGLRNKKEIEKALTKMAEELPWVKGSGVKVKHLEAYIKDIIDYQSSLISQAIQTAVRDLEDDSDEESVGPKTNNNEHNGIIFRSLPRKRGSGEILEESINEKKVKIENESDRVASKATEDSEAHSAGNSSGLESLELGSDDDTDLYILNAHEVEQRKKVLKKYGIMENSTDTSSEHKTISTVVNKGHALATKENKGKKAVKRGRKVKDDSSEERKGREAEVNKTTETATARIKDHNRNNAIVSANYEDVGKNNSEDSDFNEELEKFRSVHGFSVEVCCDTDTDD